MQWGWIMSDIAQELKSLKLHGMAATYTELASQGLAGVSASEWLLRHLLDAETTDRHIRSILVIRFTRHGFPCIVISVALTLSSPRLTGC